MLISGGETTVSGGGEGRGGRNAEFLLALAIALGTIPAAAAGLLFAGWIEQNLRDPSVIVYTLAGYGILMALADRYARRDRAITQLKIRDALIIGTAQALALVPGTSRSGVMLSASPLISAARRAAGRCSLLSTPR